MLDGIALVDDGAGLVCESCRVVGKGFGEDGVTFAGDVDVALGGVGGEGQLIRGEADYGA